MTWHADQARVLQVHAIVAAGALDRFETTARQLGSASGVACEEMVQAALDHGRVDVAQQTLDAATGEYRGTILRCLLRFTQAARKHKIGKSRVRNVIDNPLLVFRIPAPDDHSDDRILYLGDDETGRALEVLTVPIEGGELVIHAMDLRAKYHSVYDAAKEATTG